MGTFADLRHPAIFRRVFGKHLDLCTSLLNDLLGLDGDRAITGLSYLAHIEPATPPRPLEIAPPRAPKRAPVELGCRDASGTTYLIELLSHPSPSLLERAMYRAGRALVAEMDRAGEYGLLRNVVLVTICDFEIWPDQEQASKRAPRVPMLSRFRMTELDSGAEGPSIVELVFVELPKLGGRLPSSAAEMWAWLLATATEHESIPEIAGGPFRKAFELAAEAALTAPERAAYQKAIEEAREAAQAVGDAELRGRREGMAAGRHEGVVQGKRDGLTEGEVKGRREALRDVLLRWIERRGLSPSPQERARIEGETNVERLAWWADRAVSARKMADVFSEE